jgi:mono/diheme cytochrome c family protein
VRRRRWHSLLLALSAQAASTLAPLPPELDRGRYLVLLGHCNNCHTATYMERAGNVPESDWLLGNPVGFRTGARYRVRQQPAHDGGRV